MDFHRAKTFDDLVDCNLRFLRDELEYTPYRFGPLDDESYVIRDAMVAMCSELRAMTTSSQPAYLKELRRQRGYVSLFIRTEIDISTIARKLCNSSLVCVVFKYSNAETSDACLLWDEGMDNYNHVSQTRSASDSNWKGTTFFNPLLRNTSEILEAYDTYAYKASLDKSLVYIHAADDGWGYAADHCIKAVHQALKELIAAAWFYDCSCDEVFHFSSL